MEDIYIFAIVFAVLMVIFFLGCIMSHFNPVWISKQKAMLAAGDVRWGQLSTKKGDGHKIYVIKQFDVKTEKGKHRVVFDSYILSGGKYSMDIAYMDFSVVHFLMFSDPEPVYKDERI